MSNERSGRGPASLIGLRRPVPASVQPVIPIEQAEEQLLGVTADNTDRVPGIPLVDGMAVQQAVQTTDSQVVPPLVSPIVQPTVLPDNTLKKKRKEPRMAWTMKIPLEVHRELRDVCEFNDYSMSDVVIEALRRFLPSLEHPPAQWKRGRR
jgi:hypothetical protein